MLFPNSPARVVRCFVIVSLVYIGFDVVNIAINLVQTFDFHQDSTEEGV